MSCVFYCSAGDTNQSWNALGLLLKGHSYMFSRNLGNVFGLTPGGGVFTLSLQLSISKDATKRIGAFHFDGMSRGVLGYIHTRLPT